ncbi:hypothetical protein KIPB_013867, partial [Kipferlia bialata]
GDKLKLKVTLESVIQSSFKGE